MKILFVANSSLASPTGGGRTRVMDAARQACKHQHQVWILCFVRPEQWLTPSLLRTGKASLEAESGCPVLYVPRLPFTRFVLMTTLNYLYCGLVVNWVARAYGIDIFHCHGLMPAWFGLLARSIGRNKVITDVHGLLYEEAVYSGEINPAGGLAKLYQKIEPDILRKTDGTIFVSLAMQKHYEELGVKTSYPTVIPCAVNQYQPLSADNRLSIRQKLGLDEKLVFSYVGSAVLYQQVDKMCELFSAVCKRKPSAFFFILTHHVAAFQEILHRAGVSPEMFRIESVQHEDVFEYLQAGDIGFLLRDASLINRVSSPTKFGEYCSCGVPVLTTAFVGDVSQLVLSNRLGYVIDLNRFAEDGQLFAFIDDVMINRDEYLSRCQKFVWEHYSWQYYGAVLSNIYHELGQRT